jgi:hypothetical protein
MLRFSATIQRRRAGWLSGNGLDSYFYRGPGGTDFRVSLFSSDPTGKSQDNTSIMPLPLPSKTFPIQYSYVVLSFGAEMSGLAIMV